MGGEVVDPDNPYQRGRDLIAQIAKTAPQGAGVYRMLAQDHAVLYVGKAKNIQKRIMSYAQGRVHSTRIARMVAQTFQMEFLSTQTEAEAFLLESNLIKQLKPRYNVLLRDDKSFPYIYLSTEHEAPQLLRHRGARNKKGKFYGPFASGGAVVRTIEALQKGFLLRTCTDSTYEGRSRPCLLFQIKRCSGPCTREISLENYGALVEDAHQYLSGKSSSIRERLAHEMEVCADKLDFESAARLRDRLAALASISGQQTINPMGVQDADVFGVHGAGGQFCVQVFFFRAGQNWGNRSYFPRVPADVEAVDVLDSFLGQFYADKPAPKLILLNENVASLELIQSTLSEREKRKIEIQIPARGEKLKLIEHVVRNAQEALGRKMAENSAQTKCLEELTQVLELADVPLRIEIYDNSHIQGVHAIGAMVVAGAEGFMKGHYRTYNIKSTELTPGDDFGMMKEVLMRRFSRYLKELKEDEPDEGSFPNKPDLVIIDGGAGQLRAAQEVFEHLGLSDVVLLSIAKGVDRDAGRETLHLLGREPFKLDPKSSVLYFLQRLRDEAHRFAIGTHRKKRAKDMEKTSLDAIAGIGGVKKRALLNYFGSAKAVSQASEEDLTKVEGISLSLARTILDALR